VERYSRFAEFGLPFLEPSERLAQPKRGRFAADSAPGRRSGDRLGRKRQKNALQAGKGTVFGLTVRLVGPSRGT